MSVITFYHNPRCSKSRAALALLEDSDRDVHVVEYLKTPPTATELKALIAALGLEPRALLRTGEDEYRELGLDNPSLGNDALVDAMVSHPRLIERPIAVVDGRAVIGRPPERVLELLS